jgi:hypothetical protein
MKSHEFKIICLRFVGNKLIDFYLKWNQVSVLTMDHLLVPSHQALCDIQNSELDQVPDQLDNDKNQQLPSTRTN